jgi:hypothetical protein
MELAQLRQRLCLHRGADRLHFVSDDRKVHALLLWLVNPREGGEHQLHHHQLAHQGSLILPQPPFGQVDDQDAGAVHEEAQIQLRVPLAEYMA